MWLHLISQAALICAVVLAGISAHASYIYSYVGNTYDSILLDDTFPAGTYTRSMRLTFSFELASPIPPNAEVSLTTIFTGNDVLSFSVNDGRRVYTEIDGVMDASIETDELGHVDGWSFFFSELSIYPGEITRQVGSVSSSSLNEGLDTAQLTEFYSCVELSFPAPACTLGSDSAQSQGHPGTWTITPEPATPLLLGLGLVGLARCDVTRRGLQIRMRS